MLTEDNKTLFKKLHLSGHSSHIGLATQSYHYSISSNIPFIFVA